MMKNLLYTGYCVSGFSFFLLLGQIIKGFPESRNGAIALFIVSFLVIVAMGFSNWCGLWYQTNGHLSRNQSIVGFAPVYVFGTAAIVALSIGIIVGG
jgi:hypothetical protein